MLKVFFTSLTVPSGFSFREEGAMEESGQLIAMVVEHEEEEFCILSWMKKDRSLLADALDGILVCVRDKKAMPFKRTGTKTGHKIVVIDPELRPFTESRELSVFSHSPMNPGEICMLSSSTVHPLLADADDRSLLADALDVMSVYVIDKKTRPLKRTGAKTAHEILVMDLDEYFEKW